MFRDGRSVDDGTEMAADLCVIGAGAAGITLTRALRGLGLRIVLLETGGLDPEAPGGAEIVGAPYPRFEGSRLAGFGGSTMHWDGYCVPLDETDLAPRPWVPLSGWPLRMADLLPHYARAREVLTLAEPRPVPSPPGTLPLDPARIVSRAWQVNAVYFGQAFKDELARADDVQVLYAASATSLVPNELGTAVERVEIGTRAGNRVTVRARAVILAGGGLENPRLLLASERRHGTPLGNRHDMVGRCFMEHLAVPSARVLPDRRSRGWLWHGLESHGQALQRGYLALAPEVQARREVLNAAFRIYPTMPGLLRGTARLLRGTAAGEACVAAALHLLRRPQGMHAPTDERLLDAGKTMLTPTTMARAIMHRLRLEAGEPHASSYDVWTLAEQAPNPDSRVLLSDAPDPLGVPGLRLDWRLSELERRSVAVANATLEEAIGDARAGRLGSLDPSGADLASWHVEPSFHHMGTTRMSATDATGVVDADCRVHGLSNLWCAGSSVFPTGGWANPTLTIVALSLRLADHVAEVLQPGATRFASVA